MSTKPSTETLPGYAESQKIWQSALVQSEAWMKGQPDVLAKIQAAGEKWMTHRQEDLAKALEAYKQMCECKDFATAAAIQQTWFAECSRGLIADWMALMSPLAEGIRHQTESKKEKAITVKKVSHETTA
jgi:hypothetical protein